MAEKPVVEKVELTDGRTVDFVGKRKMNKRSYVAENGQLYLQIDFRNGETRTYQLNSALFNQYALHGAEQKFGDEVSGVDEIDDMVLAMDELAARHDSGEWGIKREASGIAGTSILLRALVELTGKSVDAIKALLAVKTPAEKAALRKSAKLMPIIQRLDAEKASKKGAVDVDSIFAELEG